VVEWGYLKGVDVMVTVRFEVFGRVQMVGYRYFALREAQRRRITGYVRNLPGGSVEITAQGEAGDVEAFAAALRRGPISAEVERMVRSSCEDPPCYDSFSIRF
jgi:acylphosphatase